MQFPLKLICISLLCAPVVEAQQIIRLYPGKVTGSESWSRSQQENNHNAFNTRVVYNLVDPSLMGYRPGPAAANGTTAIICPGGGFQTLSIDNEEIDVSKYPAAKVVTAFVLS